MSERILMVFQALVNNTKDDEMNLSINNLLTLRDYTNLIILFGVFWQRSTRHQILLTTYL